jgi:hypothetical protein
MTSESESVEKSAAANSASRGRAASHRLPPTDLCERSETIHLVGTKLRHKGGLGHILDSFAAPAETTFREANHRYVYGC